MDEPEEKSKYGPEYIDKKIEESQTIVDLIDSRADRQFHLEVKPLMMMQSMKNDIDSTKVSLGQVNFSLLSRENVVLSSFSIFAGSRLDNSESFTHNNTNELDRFLDLSYYNVLSLSGEKL